MRGGKHEQARRALAAHLNKEDIESWLRSTPGISRARRCLERMSTRDRNNERRKSAMKILDLFVERDVAALEEYMKSPEGLEYWLFLQNLNR